MSHGRTILTGSELQQIRETVRLQEIVFRGLRTKCRIQVTGTAHTWRGSVRWNAVVEVPATLENF